MSKNLQAGTFITQTQNETYPVSPDRHGLDYDRVSLMGGARSDVTQGLWKTFGSGA